MSESEIALTAWFYLMAVDERYHFFFLCAQSHMNINTGTNIWITMQHSESLWHFCYWSKCKAKPWSETTC